MLLLIKFTEPLIPVEDRGWKPGNVGGVFPFEVVDHVGHSGGETTLALMPPSQLKLENEVFTILWESLEKTIIVAVHSNLVDILTLKRQ